jgi:hypothetical protein
MSNKTKRCSKCAHIVIHSKQKDCAICDYWYQKCVWDKSFITKNEADKCFGFKEKQN